MVFLFINDGMVLGPGGRLPLSRSGPQALGALGKRSVVEGEGGGPKAKEQGVSDALRMASGEVQGLVRDALLQRQVKVGGPLGKEESEIFVALERAEKILAKPQDKTTGIERVRARHTVMEAGVAAMGLLNEALKAGEGEEAGMIEPVKETQRALQTADSGKQDVATKNLIGVLSRLGTIIQGIADEVKQRMPMDGTQLRENKVQADGIRLWAGRLEGAKRKMEEAVSGSSINQAKMKEGMKEAVEAMQGVTKQIEIEDATGGAANRKNIGRMLIAGALVLIVGAVLLALMMHAWPILAAAAAVILLVGGIYGVYTMVTRRESAEWQGGLDAIKVRLELLQGAIAGTLRVEADKPLPPHIMRTQKKEPKPPMLNE